MNGQSSEKRRTPAWGQVVLVAVVALLVAGTGMVLIPRDSATPAAVSFSESARAGASADALGLLEAAGALSGAEGPEAKTPALAGVVTLLTTQARALMAPDAASGSSTPASTIIAGTVAPTRASLLEQLSASGRKRLADAREADGGIARLLAAVGTAQLIHSERLAAAWQLPLPADPSSAAITVAPTTVPAATPTAAACPSVSPTPNPSSATTDSALAAAVRSQQEAVYAYQVALKRLDAGAATGAAKDLQVHALLLKQAEALTRANCADVPPASAGYQLPELFAKDPAAALGALEASSLPGFADLVALSTGETRAWAVDGLLAAARRSVAWGAALAALPGITFDAGQLPELPTSSTSSTPATVTSAG